MIEQYYDKLLNIKTMEEQEGFNKSFHYHRYEPTSYYALETLFEEYVVTNRDHIVDFGCGKGRLNFYIHYFFQASVVGVEMNEMFYQDAIQNLNCYFQRHKKAEEKIHFSCCLAENYRIDPQDNCFYFFNPFSIQVFMKVINNILISVEETNRDVEVILYYPSEDYIFFLENQTSFELKHEIRLPIMYEHNSNERFLIYRLTY